MWKGLPLRPFVYEASPRAAPETFAEHRVDVGRSTVAIPEATSTGMLDFRDWQTWYRITGDLASATKTPVVVLHGGPGATHNYTLRMARLVEQGWPVIHYDQLGAGLSTHLPDKGPGFWTVDLFLDELDNLLGRLDIRDDYFLIGQSWGGMLGAEHAIQKPAGLRGLVIADSPASMELWVSEANRLRDDLPPEVQKILLRHEEAGTTGSDEYAKAERAFYDRHVCRVVPNPTEVTESFDNIAKAPTVYHTMNGPSEFHVIGTLRDWSVVDRVSSITAPTLLVSGAHDEATPATMQPFMDGIPDVRWEIFAESSHMPHVEEEDRFLSVVGEFLQSHEVKEAR
jgi:L-proline amide hydrolase